MAPPQPGKRKAVRYFEEDGEMKKPPHGVQRKKTQIQGGLKKKPPLQGEQRKKTLIQEGLKKKPSLQGEQRKKTLIQEGLKKKPSLQGEQRKKTQIQGGLKKEPPPQGEQGKKTPPQGGLKKKTPPQGELKKKTPPQGELKKKTPPQGELKKKTPPQGELKKKTPPQGGLKKKTPPQGGLKKKTPPQGGLKKKTPPQGGLKKKTGWSVQEHKPRDNGKQQEKFISGSKDPFPGHPYLPKDQKAKYERVRKSEDKNISNRDWSDFQEKEKMRKSALIQAVTYDLLLPEEAGFLEGDEGEDTCMITQQDITEMVDITSATKHFNLNLNQFGPYRMNYSRNGRHLLLAGQRGHVATMDWHTKKLYCEINVMETINDVRWLHNHSMFAAAQKKWLYIYDNLGVELHCIKQFNDVLRMEFLPYHFLLATCSSTGFLQYLDVSIGKEIAATCVKAGRLNVMCQNPHNAIIHLGHHNGTVSLWSPTVKEPLVKMLCHKGALRALSIDKTGMYMASSGSDRKMTIFDLRTYRPLSSCFLPLGAGSLCHSQRGLLAAGVGNVVQVYKDTHVTPPRSPYMCLSVTAPIHGLQFCPYEDVLGIGHGGGFTSMIVPGAGEANFDALESNPYETKKQRREWEVKALLEKIQPELITLDPTKLVEDDPISVQQRIKEQAERMGIDPNEKTPFVPSRKTKGRSSTGNLLKRKKIMAYEGKREEIQRNVEEREQKRKNIAAKVEKKQGLKSALDRFKK